MKNIETGNRKVQLPFTVIERAVGGDVDAINTVIAHFDRYMIHLATMQFGDNVGNFQRGYDADVYERLRTKLIARISTFKMETV